MINKKKYLLVITFLILNLLTINLVSAETAPGLPDSLTKDPSELISETQDKTQNYYNYLSTEWQNMLLKNKFVSSIDSFFSKISIVFFVLFGQHYSFSLTLLVIIFLWFYLFIRLSGVLRDFSAFPSSTSKLISLGIVIVMAHMQILRKIVEFFGWLIFMKEAIWWRTIILGIIIIVLILIYYLTSHFGKIAKEQREHLEKTQEKHERKMLHGIVEGFKNAFK